MVIEKGKDWGRQGSLPEGAPAADSDVELARLVEQGETHCRLRGGDLARTLGVNAASLARDAATLLPVDAIAVTLDDEPLVAVAHVLVGSRRRPDVAVMNAAFVGDRNIAPRAHPGDGRLDIVSFELSWVDWIKAQRRMPAGTHLPHPGIATRQVPEWSLETTTPVPVVVDGVRRGRVSHITCQVVSEAAVVGV